MRITGYRSLVTVHDWGRPIGDVNGVVPGGITEVPVLVLTTDSELVGIGLGQHAEIGRVFPVVDGEDPRAVPALYDRMLSAVFKSGHQGSTYGAIAAIDMALWDLKAKMAGEPLWRTLGGRDPVVPGYASGLDAGLDDAGLEALHTRFAAAGFTGAKVKGGLDVEVDLHRIRLVTDLLSRPGRPAWCALDVNEVWNGGQARRYLRQAEQELDLAWVEEPLRRWDADGMARLRASVGTPIATGENLTGSEMFRPLLDAGAVDIVQTGSVWGITHFLRVAAAAHARDLPVSPVGYHCNPLAAAASAIPNHLTTEIQDLIMPVGLTVDQRFDDGAVILGTTPGLGIVLDETAIEQRRSTGPWAQPWASHLRPDSAGKHLHLKGTS
ncbi:mandelate racemase/muconate lactonizing enzyme family protein [Nakamurella sp. YIM 132087]|uniref:Mandelate racemase/muconate lactonizing enzyme family protein n=1 Tax=Nakamurella alba TaxID=2665158 RepID=A0A7K1FGX5_9ACTN|nr:mandelate racemase/muconate lactonizing enzyme family protein [Nakamurella alba]MTD13375.1 mandelate racemase/muconate lactonizing enzyme family protein [Nakamurella alba]